VSRRSSLRQLTRSRALTGPPAFSHRRRIPSKKGKVKNQPIHVITLAAIARFTGFFLALRPSMPMAQVPPPPTPERTILQYPFNGFNNRDLDDSCAGLGELAVSRDDFHAGQRSLSPGNVPGVFPTVRASTTYPNMTLTDKELATLSPRKLVNDGPLNFAMRWYVLRPCLFLF